MTSKSKNQRKLRPGHLIIFLVFIVVRRSFATENDASPHGPTDHPTLDSHNVLSSTHKNGGAKHEHGHEEAHFSVFHVNFTHVEIPFIIALWIFVSSLAKVGKLKY